MKTPIIFFSSIFLVLVLWMLIMSYPSKDFNFFQDLWKKEVRSSTILSNESFSKRNEELTLSINEQTKEVMFLMELLEEELLLREENKEIQNFNKRDINSLRIKIKALEKRQREYDEVIKSVYRHLLSVQDSVFTEMKRLRESP